MSDETPTTLMDELTAIKTVEDKLIENKVANFAYTDHAYNNPLTEADGVETYDVNAEQNIPVANASTLKVNATILTKGWRAQASSITRMLMNHFLGRCSYNLNKLNDLFSTFLIKLMDYMEQPNGLATLDANGKVTALNNVVNTGDSATPAENGTDKFTTGGAYTELAKKAPNNHASSTTTYGVASSTNYGHVRTKDSIEARNVNVTNTAVTVSFTKDISLTILRGASLSSGTCNVTLTNNTGADITLIKIPWSAGGGGAIDLIGGIASGASQSLTVSAGIGTFTVLICFKDSTITTVN